MKVTNDQIVRFKNMVHDFAVKHHLYHRFWQCQGELDRLEVEFMQNLGQAERKAKTYAIDFLEVRSLTEAATPMFADALVYFGKIETCPDCSAPTITNVIFNYPATIVFWSDGTKTVVKCMNEPFDPEKGLAMAISKKMLGNKGNYFNEIKKWVDKFDNPTCFYAFHGVYRDNVDVTGLVQKAAERIANVFRMNRHQKEKSRQIRYIMRMDRFGRMTYKEARRQWNKAVRAFRSDSHRRPRLH